MKNQQNPEGYLFSKSYSNYVFMLLFLLYMFDYIDRMIVTSMFPFIIKDWGISHTQSGMLVSAVGFAILLLTFPVSILIDRWSRSKTIGIMAILWSIATALCALTGNFVQLFMARLLIGVGEAGYAPGGMAMIAGLYPINRRSRMMGLWNASIPLGTAIGTILGGIIATKYGWKHAFGIVAIPGFLLAVLFLFVKDYKTVDLSFVDHLSKRVKMSAKDIFREFITKPSLIFTYFGIAAVVFVTTSLITWLPAFFQEERGLTPAKAGTLSGMVMVLALVGAPLGGFLIDKWRKTESRARLLFPTISTLFTALFLFAAINLSGGIMQIILFLFMGVFIMLFVSGAGSVTQDVIHPGLRAMSYSVAVIIQHLLGTVMAPVVVGRIYDKTNIKTALEFLPLILLLGGLLFYLGSRKYNADMAKVARVNLEAGI
ncbi:MAG TPA: MFS transporter [Bacteroidales bacterium]|jgi:MFS family permease|nr:MFS transporter [Bacteroidales bacterium]